MKHHKSWAWAMVLCFVMTPYAGHRRKWEDKEMVDCFKRKGIGLFLGGVLFDTAGVKVLASTDAKKFYINCLAAGLQVKDYVMTTAISIREDVEGILAGAEEVNVRHKQGEVSEDESGAEDQAVSEEMTEESTNVATE